MKNNSFYTGTRKAFKAIVESAKKNKEEMTETEFNLTDIEEGKLQLFYNFVDFIGYAEQQPDGGEYAENMKTFLAVFSFYSDEKSDLLYNYSPSGELQRVTWNYNGKEFCREYDPGNGRKLYAAMMDYKTDPATMPAFGY